MMQVIAVLLGIDVEMGGGPGGAGASQTDTSVS